MNKDRELSRRDFLMTISGAGLAMMIAPAFRWAGKEKNDRVMDIVSRTIGVDTHNHLDVPFDKNVFDKQTYNLSGEMKKSGFAAISMTFCVDRPKLEKEGEAFDRFIISLDEHDKLLLDNNMKRALNFSDLEKAHKQNKPIVIQSVEGGHFLEGKIERLDIAYKRGLRHLGLLHDAQSAQPLGDIYTNQPKFGGLTEFGKQVVKRSNELGMLVDLAHCSDDGINDALEISSKPMIISHTGLNTRLGKDTRMAEMMKPRLISAKQAKIFANAGGVIGVWTHLADSPLELAENIMALVDVVGVDHVCIGTDTRMEMPSGNDRFGRKTNDTYSAESTGFLFYVVEAMLKAGFSEREVSKIAGGNYCRIFNEATR